MINGLAQVSIPAGDVERAVAFYREVMGLPVLFEYPGLAFFDAGGVRVMVGTGTPSAKGAGSLLYFRTPDVAAMTEQMNKVRKSGVRVVSDPAVIARMDDRNVWLAHFEDPEGNMISLMCDEMVDNGEAVEMFD